MKSKNWYPYGTNKSPRVTVRQKNNSKSKLVCVVSNSEEDWDVACQISAAPDALAVCRRIIDMHNMSASGKSCVPHSLLTEAQVAVAKSEGRLTQSQKS